MVYSGGKSWNRTPLDNEFSNLALEYILPDGVLLFIVGFKSEDYLNQK